MDERTFWDTLDRTGDCWEWTGRRMPKGYGRLWLNGIHTYAHRAAYELTVGPIPPNGVVCHRCDNPACARPAHLFVGMTLDNMRDKVAKRRVMADVDRVERLMLLQDVEQAARRYAAITHGNLNGDAYRRREEARDQLLDALSRLDASRGVH